MAGSHAHHHHSGSDHGHHHGHSHDHHALPKDFGRAFVIGITLNLAFVVVEAGAGFVGNSMALVADAGHNLSDVLGLALAWGAQWLGNRPPTGRFTYGFQGSSILAALANALLLILACGAIAWEGLYRLFSPEPAAGTTMMIVAGIGIVINLATALMFARGRNDDLNLRGAYLHMMADALVSLGVVVAGLLTLLTAIAWIDPLTSLIVVLVILVGTWGLLRDSIGMTLNAVPAPIAMAAVEERLAALPGVERVHHLHIWPMSTTASALTVHLVIPDGYPGDSFLADAAHMVEHEFGISHATFQLETGQSCEQDDCHP